MTKLKVGFTMLVLMMLVLAACSKEKYPPTAINEDVDRCEICNMAIKDDQYATQIITTEGQALKFDDIGCLNTWKEENDQTTIGAAYVRDYNSMEWIKYDKAYYVYDQDIQTPMAYGIISFEEQKDAEAFIAAQGVGTLLTAADLDSHSWETTHGHGDHSHSHEGEHSHGHEEGDAEHGEMDMSAEDIHGHADAEDTSAHDSSSAH